MASTEVNIGPRDGVEGDVRSLDDVVSGRERAVGGPLAQELDERVQVVGRLPGRGLLVEGLVGREHQREMPVEELAEGEERALEAIPAGASDRQDRIHRIAEVGRKLADQGGHEHLEGQPLPPERGARAPRGLSDPLERQSLPALLAEDGDRRSMQFLVDKEALPFLHQ